MRRKKEKILGYELPVKVRKLRDGGYFAVCSSWEECYAQGETIEEVLQEIVGVASTLIEIFQEEGKKIPLKREKTASYQKSIIHLPVYVAS